MVAVLKNGFSKMDKTGFSAALFAAHADLRPLTTRRHPFALVDRIEGIERVLDADANGCICNLSALAARTGPKSR